MKRKDDDLRTLFERLDRQIPIDRERKARTLTKLSEIMDQKHAPHTVSWFSILKSQLCYMEKKVWLLGLLANLGFAGLMPVLHFLGMDVGDMTACSMLASSMLGVCSIWILSGLSVCIERNERISPGRIPPEGWVIWSFRTKWRCSIPRSGPRAGKSGVTGGLLV